MPNYAITPDEHSMSADAGSWVQFQLRSSADGSGEWEDATPQYWTIDDESIASIDQTSGAATAVGPGTAYVTAVVDADTNQVAFATLTVTGSSVPGLTHYVISPEYPSLGIGEWVQLQLRSSVEGSNAWDDASAQYWTIDDTVGGDDRPGARAPSPPSVKAPPTSPPSSTPTRTRSPSYK